MKYQLVKFDEGKWGVRRPKAGYKGYDEYLQPRYKHNYFSADEVIGVKEYWVGSEMVAKYCIMPEKDARKLFTMLNTKIQDVKSKEEAAKALVAGAVAVEDNQ